MLQNIKKYFFQNKKAIFKKAIILALFLFCLVLFFWNFEMSKRIIFTSIEIEKNRHGKEICFEINEIDKQADFFLEKIETISNEKKYLDKEEKKEMVVELRKIESKIRNLEIAYFGFYNNDLSIKFFSENNDTEADRLFSSTKHLPFYGYRAIYSMEDALKNSYLASSQLDLLEIEFEEIKEKIKSIRSASSFCE